MRDPGGDGGGGPNHPTYAKIMGDRWRPKLKVHMERDFNELDQESSDDMIFNQYVFSSPYLDGTSKCAIVANVMN